MADRIKQEFIVDAAKAIIDLGNLKAGLDGVNSSLRGLGGVGNVSQSVKSAAGDLKDADTSARSLTVSWQTLTRVFATQVIVSVLGKIKRGLADAASEAAEFQRRIALIETLADPQQDIGAAPDSIRADVSDIAIAGNIPIIEAATAAYDALSNQVGNLEESLQFTSEAIEFAKATNSSLNDSVDLLSAAMRSYGLDVTEAGDLSGLFFTIIDKGRISADELANTFGRIGAPAAELGVELEELGTVISVISDKGFKTSETLTQFRGIVNSLQKPTPALTKALRELGFESAEAAIKQLGLVNTLKQLKGSTEGSNEAFFKLFPNIRGSTGILATLSTETSQLDETMLALRENAASFAEEKALLITATDAEVLGKTFNQLKIEATNIGVELLGVARSLVDLVGGSEAAANIFGDLLIVVSSAVGVLATATVGVQGFNLATAALAANPGIAAIGLIGAGIGAVVVAVKELDKLDTERLLGDTLALAASFETSNTISNRQINSVVSEIQDTSTGVLRAFGTVVQEFNAEYGRTIDGIQVRNDALVANTKDTIEDIVKSREGFVRALRQEIDSIDQLVAQSASRVVGLTDQADQAGFNREIADLDQASQVFALTERASDKAREAAKLLSEAGNDDAAIQRGLDLFKQAQSEAIRAESIADAADNRALEALAADEVDSIIQKQIESEKRLQSIQRQRQQEIAAEADRQAEILANVKEQAKIVLDNTGLFDSNGAEFSQEDQARRAAAREAALRNLGDLSISSDDFELGDILNLSTQIQEGLSQKPIALAFELGDSIDSLKSEFDASFSAARANFPLIDILEERLGGVEDRFKEITSFSELQSALGALDGIIERGSQSAEVIAKAQRDAEQARQLAEQAFTSLGQEGNNIRNNLIELTAGGNDSAIGLDATNNALLQLGELLTSGEFSTQQVQDVLDGFAKATEDVGAFDRALGGLNGRIEVLNTIADNLKTISDAREKVAEESDRVLDSTGGQGLDVFQDALVEIATTVDNLDLQAKFSFQDQNEDISAAATASRVLYDNLLATQNLSFANLTALSSVGNGPTAGGQQFGNMISPQFFASGGRGVDTIPAVLSAGEFVVNSKASRANFGTLSALNAGQQPLFRATGGSTTNVGDINLNFTGNQVNPTNARQVATQIKREIRRRGV